MPQPRKPYSETAMIGGDHQYERLSPITENYLLVLYKLWEDSDTPTITQLTDTLRKLPPAEGLGTSVPSVTGMIRRMQKQGLVDVNTEKKIVLTKKGLPGAENIARRHRLAEWLVVQLLGMDLHTAHIEAHRLEHGISQELEVKLMERLNYPTKSPFGRPIPGTGEPNRALGSITLETASPNITYIVEQVPEEDVKLLKFLVESLIIPNHEVKILEAAAYLGVMTLATQMGTVSIGYSVAKEILVCPSEVN
jgi:Mn-dependent DtxR family transcriptional regulator